MKNSPLPFIIIFIIIAAIVSVEGGLTGGSNRETSTSTPRSYTYTRPETTRPSRREPATEDAQSPVKQSSPYSSWVSMSGFRKSEFSGAPGGERITISLSSRAPGPINISGWQIWSVATGNRATIPQGTSYVMEQGNTVGPIVLQPGDKAIVYSGYSPLETSFQFNMCLPYLRNTRNFPASVGSRCPSPEDVAFPLPFFDRNDECTIFIERLRSCEVPRKDTDFPEGLPTQCEAYVKTITGYDNCMRLFQNDAKFSKNEWWIFLERPARMYATRGEKILLFDENGVLVDEY